MFQVKQNESTASRKRLPIMLVDLTDGFTAEVGVTSPTISVSKNGAAAASGTGSFVEIGLGQYYYEFASGEIDTLGWTAVYVIKTGTTRAYNAIVQIMAYDYAAGTNLGLSSLPTAAIGATGALLTSYTSNGALDVTATGAVNNVETVVNGVTLTAGTGSSVAQDVWNYDISGIGATNLAGGALEAAAGGTAGAGCSSAVEIAQEVWNYDLTGYYNDDLAGTRLFNAPEYVWTKDVESLGQDIWQANSKLINIVNSVYDANIPGQIIGQNVWNYDTSGISPGSLAGGYLNDINTWTSFLYNSWGDVAAIPGNVWAYDTTGFEAPYAAYQLNTAAGLGASIAEIPNNVWSTDISGYTSPSAGYELLNAGAGVSSALSDADAAGLRYRLGLDGTATAPSATGNLGVNSGSINSVTTVSGNVLGNVAGNVSGNIEGNLDGTVNNVNSLSQPAVQTIWQYEEVGIGLTTSIGYRLKTNVDAQISAVDNNVWNYNTGTGNSAAEQLNLAAAGGAGVSAAQIADAVWSTDPTSYSGQVAGAILNDINTNALSAANDALTAAYNTGDIGGTVWGTDISAYTSPSAGYELLNAGAGSGGSSAQDIAAAVWDANVVGVGDTTSAAYYLANTLYTTGNIEAYVQNQTPQDIWSYSGVEGRTITGGTGVTLATGLPSNFSLLSINGSGQVTTSNPGSGSSSPAEIAAATWAYGSGRTVTGGTITTNSDKTGYSLTQSFPSNFSILSINGSGQVTTSNPGTGASSPTQIAQAVWQYNTGTGASAAGQLNLAAIGDSAATAKAVWDTELTLGTYPTSNLAGHQLYITNANTDQIPLNVWQYDPGPYKTNGYASFGGVMWAAATGASAAQNVWNYNTGTGASAAAQLNAAAVAGSGASSALEIAQIVWGLDISGYTSPSAGYELLNAGAGSGASSPTQIAQAVWAYNTGTGASAASQLNSSTAGSVWNYSISWGDGNVAGYYLGNAIPGLIDITIGQTTNIAGEVFGDTIVNISGDPIYGPESAGFFLYNAGLSATSASSIAQNVWNYNTGTGASASAQLNAAATAGSGGSSAVEIADAVWSYDISTGPASPSASYYINNIDTSATSAAADASTAASNTSDIGGTVWGYDPTALTSPQAGAILTDIQTDTNSIITDIGNLPNNVWASDVSGYSTPGEAGYELMNAGAGSGNSAEVASAVWSFATKDITGGTIDTNNDKTGYDLNQAFPSNFSTLSINGSGQVTTSNPGTGSSSGTEIASAVWSAVSRTVTGGSDITLASGQVPTNFTTLNIDGSGKVSVQAADISTIKSGLSTLTQAQVGTEVDSSLSDVGLTTTVTGRIDAAISSRLASASAPVNFSTLAINGSGEVTTSNPGTGASATQIASAVWTANRASIGASNGQFGYYLDAPVSTAGGTVTQVMLGPFALAATDGNNGYLNVFVDDERPVELVITDQNGNAIPLDTNNTHSVLVYDSGSTLVATYTGTVEYEAGGLVSFPLDADVTATAGSYKVVFDIDNGLTISKYGGLTILVRLC